MTTYKIKKLEISKARLSEINKITLEAFKKQRSAVKYRKKISRNKKWHQKENEKVWSLIHKYNYTECICPNKPIIRG